MIKYYTDKTRWMNDKSDKEEARKAIDDVFNIELAKNEQFKAALDRIVWENFEVPLIHSTEHNTTIYARKADA